MSDSVSPPTPEPPRRLDYVTKCATCQRYYPTDSGCSCSQPPAEVSRPTRPAASDDTAIYSGSRAEHDAAMDTIAALRVEVSELREERDDLLAAMAGFGFTVCLTHKKVNVDGGYCPICVAARVVGVVADTPPALEQNAGAG